ncbi:MAG: GntR family transcriptional regulator [Lachnospiraceae bacterium]|nr:GntR family transcriptional regulator [Lachnospiraceae bacterium]
MKAKKTLKETAAEGIYHDIEEGIYKANDIITEGEIVERYAMSKSPVREALIELCKDGVLKSIPRVGYQVVQISIKEIMDLLEVRIDLETANLKRLAPRITDEDLEMLKHLESIVNLDVNRKVAINWNRNTDFHIKLCELGGNAYLCDTIERALMKSRQYIAQYFFNAWDKNAESNGYFHRATIDALEKQDVELAVLMLQKDILNVKNQIQETYFQ